MQAESESSRFKPCCALGWDLRPNLVTRFRVAFRSNLQNEWLTSGEGGCCCSWGSQIKDGKQKQKIKKRKLYLLLFTGTIILAKIPRIQVAISWYYNTSQQLFYVKPKNSLNFINYHHLRYWYFGRITEMFLAKSRLHFKKSRIFRLLFSSCMLLLLS